MIWTDQGGLEYYHPNPQFGCYGDPVFAPGDILMQANGFAGAGFTSAIIQVADTAGILLEDATAYFSTYFGSYIYAGTTYYFYNIRCNNFSPVMLSNNCFTLRLTMYAGSTVIFDAYTQKYDLKTTLVYSSDGSIDGSPMTECIPGVIENNCNFNYIKIACAFECVDSYSGDYYGLGTAILGTPFAYSRFSWIEGRIRPLPRDIKRTVNIKCRTQRTQNTKQYLVTGDNQNAFPVWKMTEIEDMLLANHIYVNDTEYQSAGGKIFEQYGERPFGCQYRYKLSMPLQSCTTWQIFGCAPTCEDLATYYLLPPSFERIYDDSMRLVATSTDEMLIYFSSLAGNKSALSLPYSLPCPATALIQVVSSGVLPQYLYIDQLIPSKKIYPKQLSNTTLDFSSLCAVTQPYPPQLGDIFNEATPNYPPQLGQPFSESEDSYILQVTGVGDWILAFAYSSAMNNEGEVTMNISVKQTTGNTTWIDEPIAQISGNGIPNQDVVIYGTDNPNIPANDMVRITNTGEIQYTGTSLTDGAEQVIQFFSTKYNINN